MKRQPSAPTRALPLAVVLSTFTAPSAFSAVQGLHDHLDAEATEYEIVGRRLYRTVAWLAHDDRDGRRAGTQGELDSVLWLANRLRMLQLTPAGEDEFLQPFEVPLPVVDSGASWIQGAERFEGADALAPAPCSDTGTAKGPLVYRGFGIQHGEHGWNDYAAELPEGAIVLIVEGEPVLQAEAPADDAPVPAGRVGGEEPTVERSRGFGAHATTFHKVMTAARLGAAAVLLAPHPDAAEDKPEPFHPGLRAKIPALSVSRAVAEALFPGFADAARANRDADLATRPAEAPAVELELSATVERRTALAYNVLARLEGGDGPTVVVGAHLDHLGRGGTGSLAPEAMGEIHNGADDNASGCAVVLELAYELLNAGIPPGDVVFAFWSGEELGLLGSSHWAENPTVPLDEIAAYVNLDMVGRAGDGERGKLQILGAGSSPVFASWMEEAGDAAGLELAVDLSAAGVGGSDHQTFLRHEIPSLHLFTGLHGDYHRPTDDYPAFHSVGAARVLALTEDFVGRIQAAGELPFTALEVAAERSSSGWSVSFGTVPEYTFEGPGLLLSGTTPGSPADEAGLMAGDVIRKVGDVEIDDIHSFVYMLQLYKPGDVVLTRFLRDGEERTVRVTLRTREARGR